MIRRFIETAVRRALADRPVVLPNRGRQTGKTTLAQAIASKSGAHYFTLDDATPLGSAAAGEASRSIL